MIVFFDGYKSIKFNGSFKESLYEHGKYNDVRVLLTEPPLYTLTAPSQAITNKIRVSVCLTEITIFRTIPKQTPIEPSELVYFGLMRITDTELQLLLYPITYSEISDRVAHFFNNEPVIVLDLDKTLIICQNDAPVYDMFGEPYDEFKTDFTITGKTIIENAYFEHNVMIRPDCHTFLKYLFSVTSKVYILTASDLNYAEHIVRSANECGWGGGKGEVSFPLSHVYSVRNKPLTALPKTFSRIIPLGLCNKTPVTIAVDDSLLAWDQSLLHFVIPITPFTSKYEKDILLDIANRIHEIIS